MRLGFAGSRRGLTAEQRRAVREYLLQLRPRAFHHGDCRGADALVARLVWGELGECRIVCHPPSSQAMRAFFPHADETRPEAYFTIRNRRIVEETDRLLATPKEDREPRFGGTWNTVRHARKCGRPVTIIWPDGSLTEECGGQQ